MPLLKARPSDVVRYVAEELERHARSTAMNRLLAVRSFFRYLVSIGKRRGDPTADIPVKRDKLQARRPYTPEEIEALLLHAKSDRDRTIMLLLLGSGLRRGELVRMKVGDVDWARGRILVHGKGAKERWVSPGPAALAALQSAVNGQKDRIWLTNSSKPMTGDEVYTMIRRAAVAASVVGAHPHRFRVTFSVSFLRRFGNLSALRELLGHSDLRMAEHYAKFGMAENALTMQAQLNLAGRLSKNPRPCARLADRL